MMEIEAKFRESDVETVKQEVQQRGFNIVAEKHQIDHYYLVGEPDADGNRHYFRLREDQTGECSLDYHQVLSELETKEHEVALEDPEELKKILSLLGHEMECIVDKQRTEYKKDDVLITIDHIEGLGDFVEIEMEGTLTDEVEQEFIELIDHLDLDEADRVTDKGYPELMQDRTPVGQDH